MAFTTVPRRPHWRRRLALLLLGLLGAVLLLLGGRHKPEDLEVTLEVADSYPVESVFLARAHVRPIAPGLVFRWDADSGLVNSAGPMAKITAPRTPQTLTIEVIVRDPDGRLWQARRSVRISAIAASDEIAVPRRPKAPGLPPVNLKVAFDKREICRGETVRAMATAEPGPGAGPSTFFTYIKDKQDDDYHTSITSAGLDTIGPARPGTYGVTIYASQDREVIEALNHGHRDDQALLKDATRLTALHTDFKVLDCEKPPDPMWGIDFTPRQESGYRYWFYAWDNASLEQSKVGDDNAPARAAPLGAFDKTETMKEVESYFWDFGDGTTARTKEPRILHALVPPRPIPERITYRVTLKVTRMDGRTAEKTHLVWLKFYDTMIQRPVLTAFATVPKLVGNRWEAKVALYQEGGMDARLTDVRIFEGEWDPGNRHARYDSRPPLEIFSSVDLPVGAALHGKVSLPRGALDNDRWYSYLFVALGEDGRYQTMPVTIAAPGKFPVGHGGTFSETAPEGAIRPTWLMEDVE